MAEIVVDRERAVHEKRRWVRLTRTCNNHCLFCLDSGIVGEKIRPPGEIRAEIETGRREGCERLILSGGEPTLHPDYLELIAYGAELGYDWIQTVSNGRMFSYRSFASRAVAAGLCEATFSMHGHRAELHDGLVGVEGAFEQALAGMRNLRKLEIVVNVDIVLTALNAPRLPEIIDYFLEFGVREFDLLWMVPFGSAWNNRQRLFIEPEPTLPALHEAVERAMTAGAVVWTNRLPAQLLEGHEDLIQDPHKLHDEVRGRLPEYRQMISSAEPLRCSQPERCRQCPMEGYCRALEDMLHKLAGREPMALGVEQGCEITPEAGRLLARAGRVRIHVGNWTGLAEFISTIDRESQVFELVFDIAPTAGDLRFINELGDKIARLASGVPAALDAVLDGWTGEVEVELNQATAEWLAERETYLRRVSDRLLFAAGRANPALALKPLAGGAIRLLNLPQCLLQDALSVVEPAAVDVEAAMGALDGELAAFTEHYIRHAHRTWSLRCRDCRFRESCPGLPVNMVRSYGFDALCHPST